MKPVLERLPAGSRIAVIRLRSLGDCVLTTPALRILKQSRPDLRVAVVVESRFAAVFEGNPDIERLLPPSAVSIARWRPDLTINFHGGTRSVTLTLASAARHRAGFQHYRARWAYNILMPRAQQVFGLERTVHTAEHLASAIFHLGAPRCEIPRAQLFADDYSFGKPYALVHPFASAPSKAWPADRFIAVANRLREQGDVEPLILCGPNDDPAAWGAFETLRNAPLSRVKSAVKSAALFIGNDSGPAHMAAAFGVPLVVLFGPSDSNVWAPWKPAAVETIARPRIEEIAISDVLRALENLKVRA
jgi:ADP-heptose:LPS heptosyltransferase